MERSRIERAIPTGPVNRIVREVAERKHVEETALPPLYEVFDPDALTTLVDAPDDSITVEFTYCDCHVTVDSAGAVSVTDA